MKQLLMAHTPGHVKCPACEDLRAMHSHSLHKRLTFREAVAAYITLRTIDSYGGAYRARYVAPRTLHSYRQYAESLCLIFGELRLCDIHVGHMRHYQQQRLSGEGPFLRRRRPHEEPGPCAAGPTKVNHELTFLKTVMVRANAWTEEHTAEYEPLKHDAKDMPRSLTAQEQEMWLGISATQPQWALVHQYSVLAFSTCMSTDELRGLRIGDVNLFHSVITVPGRKNRYRKRTVPLVGAEVLWATEQLLSRAAELGATDPQHYLFPFKKVSGRTKDDEPCPERWDATKPMTVSGLKWQWTELRKVTGLTWFRPYDTRHTAITRLAEAGTPIDVIMSMAGHVSEAMRRHYTHISDVAKVRALQTVQAARTPMERRWPLKPLEFPRVAAGL